MEMTGEYRIEASREAVWRGLNDPEILRQSITGCEEIETTAENEFAAKVTVKLGPVKAKFTGVVKLTDLNPPASYKISGEGKGGAAGFAKGGAEITLSEDGGATILRYTVAASVGGKLAQLGGRLIDSTAKKYADEFFSKFKELTESGDAAPAADAVPAVVSADPKPAGKGLSPAIWTIALIAAIAAVVAYFGLR